MTFTESTTVGDIASAVPSSVRIFQRYGIDFCCGGRKPLGSACQEHGVALDALVTAIKESAAGSSGTDRDWSRQSLDQLIRHIVTTYHDSLREELPRLEAMAAKVSRVHGAHAPYLARITAIVSELSGDLRAHLHKEEAVLFPAIRAIESAPDRLAMPIAAITVMEHEHDHAGALLAEIRAITNEYTAPEWACATFRALYYGLSELESAMQVHVHLENTVLFPRALRLAGGG